MGPRSSPRAGFTLIEVMVAITLAAALATSAVLAASQGYDAYQTTRRTSQVEGNVRQALDRAARELMSSSLDVITPQNIDDAFGTSELVFQQAAGVANGAIAWGNPLRLRLELDDGELDDGLDNDGDGLRDEGQLVLVRDDGLATETRVVLCHDVREYLEGEVANNADDNGNGIKDEQGFNVHRSGDVLTLRLSLERAGTQTSVLRTLSTSIRLRN